MPRVINTFVVFLFVLPGFTAIGQSSEDAFDEKSFLIIGSTKSFDAAKQIAKEAAGKLKLEYDENAVELDSLSGLTFPKEHCEGSDWTYPCYVGRGRFDDGVYISVEYSNSYDGFAEGYYVVMAASGDRKSDEIKNAHKAAREFYPDCYLKKSKVYMGCMH